MAMQVQQPLNPKDPGNGAAKVVELPPGISRHFCTAQLLDFGGLQK